MKTRLMGLDIDRAYLDGVIARQRATLHQLIRAMPATSVTEIRHFIQGVTPVILAELDRARALREKL